MMPATAALLACVLAPQDGRMVQEVYVTDLGGGPPQLMMQVFHTPSEETVHAPKLLGSADEPWEFPFVVSAYGKHERSQFDLRFRVYSQERKALDKDPAVNASQMLLRLWEMNTKRLGLKHSLEYNRGVVDVYLCLGPSKTPGVGGEQLFDVHRATNTKVNTIYVYDIPGLTDTVEAAREIAHEYGHATLPAVGGFRTPEDWANGRLGECLYLRWLRDEIARKRFTTEDTMGATKEGLDAWVRANSDAITDAAALQGPEMRLLKGYGPKATDHYVGLALWTAEALPQKVFARSLVLTGSTKAKDYPNAAVLAAEEPDKYTLNIPARLRGKAVWIPLGRAKLTGATVLARKEGWARVRPASGAVTIVPKR